MHFENRSFIAALALAWLSGCSAGADEPPTAGQLVCGPIEPPAEIDDGFCLPGTAVEAYCLGSGLTGYRVCNDDVATYGPAICPENSTAIDNAATYFILTRPMFNAALEPFVAAKTAAGERVQVIDADAAQSCAVGDDVPERLRQVLRHVKAEAPRAQWLLIVGAPLRDTSGAAVLALTQPWEVPMRYVPLYPGTGPGMLNQPPIPTDQAYASVSGDWPAQPDRHWLADFEFRADFYVGRVPARTEQEAIDWVRKTNAWATPAAPVHAQLDTFACPGQVGYNPHDWLTNQLNRFSHRVILHRCQDGEYGNHADFANTDQADYVSSFWHGNETGTGWAKDADGKAMGYTITTSDPGHFTKPPVFFAHSCMTAGLDYANRSLGETLILRPDGVVAYVGFDRIAWNWVFDFWDYVFIDGYATVGEAVYEGKVLRLRDVYSPPFDLNNLFSLNVLGDPSLRVADPALRVNVSGTPVASAGQVNACLTTESKLTADLTGAFSLGSADQFGPTVTVAPGTSVRAFTGPYQADSGYPQQVLTGFSGCDPLAMSCTMGRIRVNPPVALACRNLALGLDGTSKEFDIRFGADYSGPARLVVRGQPGRWFPDGCGGGDCPVELVELVAWDLPHGIKAGTERAGFPDRLVSDEIPKPEDRGNGAYRGAALGAELRAQDGALLGRCWLSLGSEVGDILGK